MSKFSYRLAKLIGIHCDQYANTQNDVGYPVLCKCELIIGHPGPHEARIKSGKNSLASSLYQWIGQ